MDPQIPVSSCAIAYSRHCNSTGHESQIRFARSAIDGELPAGGNHQSRFLSRHAASLIHFWSIHFTATAHPV